MGKRGPKPKSAGQRKVDGSRAKPIGQGEVIQFSSGLPAPPKHLDRKAKGIFRQLVQELYTAGILKKVDGPSVAEYSQAVSDVERLTLEIRETGGEILVGPNGGPVHNPRVGYLRDARKRVLGFGAKLGLNPRDRSLIKAPARDVPAQNDEDEMAQFDAG